MKRLINIFILFCSFLTISISSNAQGTNCFGADPFCTGTTETFPNTTGTPSTGSLGCLGSTPNPAWYYLNIATSGDLNIHIEQYNTAGTPIDVDFICWGPVTDVASGCAGGIPTVSSVDCSYSGSAVEDCYIPSAVAGETYLLLLTNFSDQPGNITFSQTSGTGSTDCSILCGLSGLTAVPSSCDVLTNSYTLTGSVNTSAPPTTGTLTISTSCGGSQVFAAPFAATVNYSITGFTSDGLPCTVTAAYSDDTSCVATITFISPPACVCSVSALTAIPTACNTATMTYDVSGSITFVNPPLGGTLTVTNSCGGSQVFSAPFASPLAYNLTGIPGGSSGSCVVTAAFSAIPACTLTQNYTSPNCCSMTLSSSSTATLCPTSCDGTATVSYVGNISSLVTVVWQNAAGVPIGQTGLTAINLCAGTYIAVVSDSTICTISTTVVVSSTPGPVITSVPVVSPSCNSVCDASITINATGATGYSIDNGLNFLPTNNFPSLCAGTYAVVVENANGCTASTSVTIVDPPLLLANLDLVNNVSCFGMSDGQIFISVAGGTSPYAYSWTGGSALQDPSGLAAGAYTCTVTDNNGCTAIVVANVAEPTQLTVNFSEVDATCFGVCNGILTSAAAGGTAPYNFSWIGPVNFSTANTNAACAGVYTLNVTDANGCLVTNSGITVGQPSPLVINYVLIDNEHCAGDCLGKIEINATGATQFSIDGGSTFVPSNVFTSLCSGSYNIEIQDANGCSASQTVQVIRPVEVVSQFTYSPNPPDLFNTSVQFTNLSTGIVNSMWTFDDLGTSSQFSPQFDFPLYVADTYYVCLSVVNDSGCVDTSCLNVIVNDYMYIYLPNSFTPNGDGMNDMFIPVVNMMDKDYYKFYIFNRWGELIFSTTDPTKGWDGTQKGVKSKEDVYVWKIQGRSTLSTEKKEWIGHVNLLR